ncbi:MAG TPA: GntR family transcriptional regulator, partial [Kiloniellaceae bacterium]
MKQKSGAAPTTRLQRDLLPRIADLLRADGCGPGDRVTELRLTKRLQVSRTPVRAALAHLATLG